MGPGVLEPIPQAIEIIRPHCQTRGQSRVNSHIEIKRVSARLPNPLRCPPTCGWGFMRADRLVRDSAMTPDRMLSDAKGKKLHDDRAK